MRQLNSLQLFRNFYAWIQASHIIDFLSIFFIWITLHYIHLLTKVSAEK